MQWQFSKRAMVSDLHAIVREIKHFPRDPYDRRKAASQPYLRSAREPRDKTERLRPVLLWPGQARTSWRIQS